ncbi:MAG: UDP-2,3-diacylglucosamine diphosphatase LpxI [Pseudomonadota bacterium]
MTLSSSSNEAADGDGSSRPRLGVVAGGGALPRLVCEAERNAGGDPFVIALRANAGDWVSDYENTVSGPGQVGRIFAALSGAGCGRVCFAGALQRPSLSNVRFDFTALRVLPVMRRLMRQGDDGLLRGLAQIFEARGFTMVGAHELLGELLAPMGPLGARTPNQSDLTDIERAAEIVAALGAVDVGQGAVVARGRCLAVETVQGTDVMLGRLEGDTRRGGAPIPSGVLYKSPKPDQDLRLDLPAIGPETIRRAATAGLNGVAVRSGGVFILDVDETIAAADAAGVFLFGWDPEEGPG